MLSTIQGVYSIILETLAGFTLTFGAQRAVLEMLHHSQPKDETREMLCVLDRTLCSLR